MNSASALIATILYRFVLSSKESIVFGQNYWIQLVFRRVIAKKLYLNSFCVFFCWYDDFKKGAGYNCSYFCVSMAGYLSGQNNCRDMCIFYLYNPLSTFLNLLQVNEKQTYKLSVQYWRPI
jgi:hypothetical protein